MRSPIACPVPPFDHELAQLCAGLRLVVKREFAARQTIAPARAEGLHVLWLDDTYAVDRASAEVRKAGPTGARTALIGRDLAALAEVAELDRRERLGGPDRRHAIVRLGELLGYPSCCAEAFAGQEDGGEVATFRRLLAAGPRTGLPRGNNLFVLEHQLISHFPCDLHCSETASLARLTFALAPDATRAALASLLAAPITVWDRFRVVVDHPRWGQLHALDLSQAPRVLDHTPLRRFVDALPNTPPGGVRLCFDGDPPL